MVLHYTVKYYNFSQIVQKMMEYSKSSRGCIMMKFSEKRHPNKSLATDLYFAFKFEAQQQCCVYDLTQLMSAYRWQAQQLKSQNLSVRVQITAAVVCEAACSSSSCNAFQSKDTIICCVFGASH